MTSVYFIIPKNQQRFNISTQIHKDLHTELLANISQINSDTAIIGKGASLTMGNNFFRNFEQKSKFAVLAHLSSLMGQKKKHLIFGVLAKFQVFTRIPVKLAEGVGFEPTWGYPQTVFKKSTKKYRFRSVLCSSG